MDSDCVEIFKKLGEAEYFSGVDFVDYFSRKRVKIEPDSVNSIVIDKPQNQQSLIVTHEY